MSTLSPLAACLGALVVLVATMAYHRPLWVLVASTGLLLAWRLAGGP